MSPHSIDNSDAASVRSDAESIPQLVNGTNDFRFKSQYVTPSDPKSVHDVVCIGFGPASVAIAVALHDSLEAGKMKQCPKVLFLEKQPQFAWHAGMLLPGAKMQISFIKDLASLRDPRSHFTFLNYLHKNDRLVDFTNLDTFLPARSEYEDYLRWCARHFDDVVRYGNEVVSVTPLQEDGPTKIFEVTSRNTKTGVTSTFQARNVIVAAGGQGTIPKIFPERHPRVLHSSQFAQYAPKILGDKNAPVRVAVIGAGQSSAEIFSNIQNQYPNSKTYMIMRSEWLKPSDDSPFINSIFNPEYIDRIFPKSAAYKASFLHEARATNYGVVRLQLIEQLYETMYHQKRLLGVDEKKWPHRILAGRELIKVDDKGDKLRIKVALVPAEGATDGPLLEEEDLDVDLVVCATGYRRTAHVDILKGAYNLLPELDASKEEQLAFPRKDRWVVETANKAQVSSTRVIEVGRNYSVHFADGAVARGSGVWLQGCCEGTHGLSDTLLSVLGTRSGEIVESIFGAPRQ
ncbi:L-lysine 6-monooxygenase (NADPH-requiring)-domain-containing protein [Podospora fimiseda]|uniref:L-ornithine N(5)-monooxygenase [NAD(P)H] n=1 Tax=Podospora fimiseda TaxID=252190 RepID=A0AAN7GPJ0_9PEZI|nr:L-lysine 6-monooxygenase (NADPH-requiring)-domain-containing protein [Podospora fimiseda]